MYFEKQCYQDIENALYAAAVDDSVNVVAITGAGEVGYLAKNCTTFSHFNGTSTFPPVMTFRLAWMMKSYESVVRG